MVVAYSERQIPHGVTGGRRGERQRVDVHGERQVVGPTLCVSVCPVIGIWYLVLFGLCVVRCAKPKMCSS